MELIIDLQRGGVRCLYDEKIPFVTLGRATIERASYVEPDAAGAWWADLAPVSGPRLGPYRRRSDALDGERHWLSQLLETLPPT